MRLVNLYLLAWIGAIGFCFWAFENLSGFQTIFKSQGHLTATIIVAAAISAMMVRRITRTA